MRSVHLLLIRIEQWDRKGAMRNDKIRAAVTEDLPLGDASDKITEGCLVLEGGAFRALYEVGVLDAFMANDLNFSCVVGVSAGAMGGLSYVSGQIGRSVRIDLLYRHDPRYVGRKALIKDKGIIGFEFFFDEMDELGEIPEFNFRRFNLGRQKLISAATNCETGKTEYFEFGRYRDVCRGIKASASMPFVSKMVKVDGKLCLDGGCSCRVPVKWAIERGFKKIVVVRTRDLGYRKRSPGEIYKSISKIFYRRYPAFEYDVIHMGEFYNRLCDEMEALQADGRIYMIAPKEAVHVGRLEPDLFKLRALYDEGYRDAFDQIDAIRKYLS